MTEDEVKRTVKIAQAKSMPTDIIIRHLLINPNTFYDLTRRSHDEKLAEAVEQRLNKYGPLPKNKI